ncbi:uncharacterized protein LOC133179729 [Saccostrea echinata]|uniref:uncharacterized protein LOC133179729 n=1 Tax=Saccostrea echinata TaxID=191078 RepID=UPI002A7F1080|nr:uncharacterized protein LOC133179729 [Saccostrea echinata]
MVIILKCLMIKLRWLYLVLARTLFFVHGQKFEIWTEFLNGDVTFKWTNVSSLRNDILITKDSHSADWVKTNEDHYTVEDVLKYKSVTIEVREYNCMDFSKCYVEHKKTYNVIIVEAKEGESRNISWTADYFPENDFYRIFHYTHNGSRTRILKITKDKAKSAEKYVYHTRPLKSVNILFEVKNITVEDAGYYVGGVTRNDDDGGVILVVHGKPMRPTIKGQLTIRVGNKAFLECISRSTSTPCYYKMFPPLSYSWYINNTRIEGENWETYYFSVSKDVKYNNYSCRVKETVESERSDEVRINPLYGPEKVIISPQPPMNILKIREGDKFGPYNCSADCNPPCTFQWFNKIPSGKYEATYQSDSSHVLPEQTSNRSRTLFYCVAYWSEDSGNTYSNLTIDIQYLSEPIVYINGVTEKYSNIPQNVSLTLSCFTDGNPIPTVTISRGTRNQILGKVLNNWLNYTFPRKAQCTDSNIYRCEGRSKQYPTKVATFSINIPCKPRLDNRVEFKSTVYIRDLPNSVSVNVPIISNPKPMLITWNGPLPNLAIRTTISQRNEVYQHWVSSTIPIHNESFLGNYTVFGEGIELATIEITEIEPDLGSTPSQWILWIIVEVFAGLFVLLTIISIICKATCKFGSGTSVTSKGCHDVYDVTLGTQEGRGDLQNEYQYLTVTELGQFNTGRKSVDNKNNKSDPSNHYENSGKMTSGSTRPFVPTI